MCLLHMSIWRKFLTSRICFYFLLLANSADTVECVLHQGSRDLLEAA